MKKTFLSLVVAFAIALSFIFIQPIQSADAQSFPSPDPQLLVSQNPDKYTLDKNGYPIVKNAYTVLLKNETFAPIDNDPKFANPNQFKPSNIPERNAQVVPELLHEYTVETGAIVYDKVEQYNGTDLSSLAPLPMQGGHVEEVYSHALRGFSIINTEDISIFVNDPDIAVVEPQYVSFQDTQYNPTGIHRAQQHISTFGPDNVEDFPDIDVAVIDSRVASTHPDLNVFRTQVMFSGAAGSASEGWSTTGFGTHGTHVAGTIAARDNLGGVVGVIPGARIWSLASCGPVSEGCIGPNLALDFVTANAASIEVVNISSGISCGWLCSNPPLGSTTQQTAFANTIAAGVTIVVSAGNDRANADNRHWCSIPNVICVSALGDMDGLCGGKSPSFTRTVSGVTYTQLDDTIAYFSNFGSVVDLMAPGLNIASTAPESPNMGTPITSSFIGESIHGRYVLLSGTSMASPFVAGAAAIVKLKNPSFTPAQVLTDLQAKALTQGTACDGGNRGGLVVSAPSAEKLVNLRDY